MDSTWTDSGAIRPESRGRAGDGRGLRASAAARRAVGCGLLILLGLQAWRPFFFLTDDNLVGLFPILNSVGRSLLHGQSPFWVGTLFGGFDLLRDPSALCLWNPLVMLLAALTQTPLQMAVVDIYVGVHLLLAAFCCAHLLAVWRERFGLPLSDTRLVFVSVSYAFSAYSIIVCASWSSFAANIAAAPLALLGLFHPSRRTGTSLVVAATVMGLVDGHLSPFAWAGVSLSLFAALWPWVARAIDARSATMGAGEAGLGPQLDWEVPLRWAVGSALGIALCSPLLWLAMSGFAHTARDTAMGAGDAVRLNIPALTFVLSWLVGSLSALGDAGDPLLLIQLPSGASHAIVACGAGCFILFSLLAGAGAGRAGLRWSGVDWMFATLSLGVVLLVARPEWLQSIIGRLPLLRSLRFPFREVWMFHLWTHAWMAWRGGALTTPRARLCAVVGTMVAALSLLLWAPPTFSRLELTREWVISGRGAAFWRKMRPQLPAGARLVPTGTREQWDDHRRIPFPVLCAFNFPALFEVPSLTGYVIKGIEHGQVRRGELDNVSGLRSEREGKELLRRNADVVLVRIVSVSPLAVRFQGRGFERTVLADQVGQ